MAIAFDTSNYLNFTATSGTLSYTCTGIARILLVFVRNEGGADDVTGVTYNGNAMTEIGARVTYTPGSKYISGWYILESSMPASGSAANIVVSRSTSNDTWCIMASYTGVKQQSQPNVQTTAQFASGSGIGSTSVTTTDDNCWTILVGSGERGQSASTGSTFKQNNTSVAYQLYDSNAALTPAGNYGMAVSQSPDTYQWCTKMIAISPSPFFAVSDTITISESVIFLKIKSFILSDNISISDTITAIRTRVFTVTSNISISDSFVSQVFNGIWLYVTKKTTNWTNQNKS